MKKETTGTSSPASNTSTKRGAKGRVKPEKTQKPKKPSRGGKNYVPKGEGVGGARDHAGRLSKAERLQALGVSDTIEAHLIQEVDLSNGSVPKIADGAAPILSKKPRLLAILDMLATKALGPEQSIPAATEYLNRTLGRAKQTVEVSGSIKADDQAAPTPAEMAAAQAYEDALEAEDNG